MMKSNLGYIYNWSNDSNNKGSLFSPIPDSNVSCKPRILAKINNRDIFKLNRNSNNKFNALKFFSLHRYCEPLPKVKLCLLFLCEIKVYKRPVLHNSSQAMQITECTIQ